MNRFPQYHLKVVGAALLLAVTGTPAAAAIGEWVGDDNARVRLIAAGVDADGRLAGGIEIALAPGWKTYWRQPGDAGVAPQIDLSGSSNVGSPVEMAFPVPRRHDDGYSVTNVYEGRVVLPLSVPVTDPRSPVELVVRLDIGVCDEICIPSRFDLVLDVASGQTDREAGTILAEASASLPGPPDPGIFAVDGIARQGGTDKRPVFDLEIVAPDASEAELFIEGPTDWYPAPPELVSSNGNRAVYRVEFNRLGAKTPIGNNEFMITVVSNGRAIEDIVTLE